MTEMRERRLRDYVLHPIETAKSLWNGTDQIPNTAVDPEKRTWSDWVSDPGTSFTSYAKEKAAATLPFGLGDIFNSSASGDEKKKDGPDQDAGLWSQIGNFFSKHWGKLLMVGAAIFGAAKLFGGGLFGSKDEDAEAAAAAKKKKKDAEAEAEVGVKQEEPSRIASALGAGAVGFITGLVINRGDLTKAWTAAKASAVVGGVMNEIWVPGLSTPLLGQMLSKDVDGDGKGDPTFLTSAAAGLAATLGKDLLGSAISGYSKLAGATKGLAALAPAPA